ncbi:Boron transporter 4 [Bienertia sinuspersici]
MESIRAPFRGIKSDIQGRLPCYKQDWIHGFKHGIGILTPAVSVFFASALPAIAFGELLNKKTGEKLSSVHTLFSAAICGLIHTVFGGQPLLIQGVAEPTVLMYTFLYNFAKKREDLEPLFLAWAAWVCVWTALMLLVMAILNACDIIDRLTRIAEELIEMLIAVLFIQEAIKGIISEFQVPKGKHDEKYNDDGVYDFEWLYSNGLLAIIFSLGLIYTAFKSRNARTWWYGTGLIRNFIANFGVPMMVVAWAGLSYAIPSKVPSGVPRRLFSPHPWNSWDSWTIASHMGEVPAKYIFGAFIPGSMVAILFFFEHNVASKMAQQKEFNLKNPSAYHYDIFLLGIMTLVCGLLGLPPCYALLPQSPMHTKSLAVLKRQLIRRKLVESAKESIHKHATNSEIYGNMQAVFLEMDRTKSTNRVIKELQVLKQVVMKGENGEKEKFDPEKHIENLLPMRVNEQRLSNLLHSLLLGASVFGMPALKRLPSSLLWGYIAYTAIDGLPGNQFWERITLLFVNKSRFHKHLILPRFFDSHHLHELDAHGYEEVLGASKRSLRCMSISPHQDNGMTYDNIDNEEEIIMDDNFSIPEILDELTTHRGEIKVRTMSVRGERRSMSGRREVYPRAFSVHIPNDLHFNVPREVNARAMSLRNDRSSKVHPGDIV